MKRMRSRRLAIGLGGLSMAVGLGCFHPAGDPVRPLPVPGVDQRSDFTTAGTYAPPPVMAPARLRVEANRVLHAASPFVIGYNRNHVHRQFTVRKADRQAMFQALQRLAPRWGQAYVSGLKQQGYPAQRGAIYRSGHGPTDGRTDYAGMEGYFFQRMWGLDGVAGTWDGYPYDDWRHTLQEAEDAEAQLLVTLNFGTDTAESAGALARYMNAPTDGLRAQYPLDAPPFRMAQGAPYGAFLFEIGNEVQLPVVRGHERAKSIPAYVAAAAPYISEVRRAQGHPVKVALSAAVNVFWGGPNKDGASWEQQGAMVRSFLGEARRHGVAFEALQFHGYPSYPVNEHMAGNAYAERLIKDELAPALSGTGVEIWNDEFHAASREPGRTAGLYGALYAADATATALGLSLDGRQLIPITVDFAAWHPGKENNDDSLYFQDNDARKLTPIYHFRRLLAEGFGDHVVATSLKGVGAWVDEGEGGARTEVSNLKVVAAMDANGRTLHLLVVNRSLQDETVSLELPGFVPVAGSGRLKRIEPAKGARPAWDARWDQVRIDEGGRVDPRAPIRFPAASISLIALDGARGQVTELPAPAASPAPVATPRAIASPQPSPTPTPQPTAKPTPSPRGGFGFR